MDTTIKEYLKRNLKAVMARLGDVALLDAIAEGNLDSALATKINGKAEATDLTTLTNRVNTLVGEDTSKSARSIAAEEVTKIIDGAPDSYDTLKEIATWISDHADSASAMNQAIVALQAKTVLGTYTPSVGAEPVEYANVRAYVEAYVADQISNNITLASLSVGSATGTGNVITGLTYDSTTGVFTPAKGITAIEKTDISASDSGTGNVVTGVSYDSQTGGFTVTKGNNAVMREDLVDLTTEEINALFA